MPPSILDLFTIGIGPSSSHTIGPMLAAKRFVQGLPLIIGKEQIARLRCDLYGSLAATGKGHATDKAIVLGFLGNEPETVDPAAIPGLLEKQSRSGTIEVQAEHCVPFVATEDLSFHRVTPLPRHPNGMHFLALSSAGKPVHEEIYYSLGGGVILRDGEDNREPTDSNKLDARLPHRIDNAAQLLDSCRERQLSIAELTLENESFLRPETEVRSRLDAIWSAMQECVRRGIATDGVLPGGLKVARRAPAAHRKLLAQRKSALADPLSILDWVNLYALAVNEENAAGGRVVTAPTNGAAGVIPAVLHYATRFCKSPHEDAVQRMLLTAGAIGLLYKKNASISGADVGCQGEVGVACSMAAGGLVEFLGGTVAQAENAAEIGMEHNLGLTCDPVGGLVQIPCIERNAMASVKAINAARIAMSNDGAHHVSLDSVIKTMRETGRDMRDKYKETSRGGLAVNVIEC